MKVNAHIGEYQNATQRRTNRVLTHFCPCGSAAATILEGDEVPDEGLCRRCWRRFPLRFGSE